MTIDYDGNDYETEETPAQGDKAEAIRRKYCLENDQVYEDTDNTCVFWELPSGAGDKFLCFELFELSEIDAIYHEKKWYYIKRTKN